MSVTMLFTKSAGRANSFAKEKSILMKRKLRFVHSRLQMAHAA